MSDFFARLKANKSKPAGEHTLAGSGFTVHLRRWTVGERRTVADILRDQSRGGVERYTDLLALTLCDENNALFCADGKPTPELLALELGADADAIVTAGLDANGFGEKKVGPTSQTSSAPTSS
jgi:hypothetical protein